jgi:hypothetical protein
LAINFINLGLRGRDAELHRLAATLHLLAAKQFLPENRLFMYGFNANLLVCREISLKAAIF